MSDLIKLDIDIENMIYEIRDQQVMLASDVAKLYNVETKRINEVVKRNLNRFPIEFCFQLTKEETQSICLRSQSATLNKSENLRGLHLKYLPYVFTEHGVMMLSSLLKSDIAAKMNVKIIKAFVKLKRYISSNLIQQSYINDLVIDNTKRIKLLEESFSKFEEKKVINEIYFNGQIYDAYSKIKDIFKEATEELIIIDAYADKTTLDIIKELDVKVILVINEKSKITKLDIEKYNEQYNNLKLVYDNSYHDRYFILDKKVVYHSGTSINNAGSKTFSINKLDDDIVIFSLINNLNKKGIY